MKFPACPREIARTRRTIGAQTPETWSATMRCKHEIDFEQAAVESLSLPPKGERLFYDTRSPNLALRLRSSGARTWVAFRRRDGKIRRETLGDATTLSILSARALCSREIKASTEVVLPTYPEAATVRMVMDGYLAFGHDRRWKPSTGRMMEAAARLHIFPILGQRQVRSISRSEIMEWHWDLARQTTTARMALSTLSGMFSYAEDHGLRKAGSNPCRGLRKKASSERGSYLAPSTMRHLWIVIARNSLRFPIACDVIRLLAFTGARKGEVLSLEWDWIEGARAVLPQSKSGPRTIWLNSPSREILDRRKSASRSRFVFPCADNSAPRSSIDTSWNVIRQAAGLPTLRLHDLRHHFAAVGVANGIDLKIVGALLGHHDIDSTMVYAHLPVPALKRSANRVSNLIDDALSSSTAHGRSVTRKSEVAHV